MSPESSHAEVTVSSTALPLSPARRRATEAIHNLLDITTDSGTHQSEGSIQDKSLDEATQGASVEAVDAVRAAPVSPGEKEDGACKARVCTV